MKINKVIELNEFLIEDHHRISRKFAQEALDKEISIELVGGYINLLWKEYVESN